LNSAAEKSPTQKRHCTSIGDPYVMGESPKRKGKKKVVRMTGVQKNVR